MLMIGYPVHLTNLQIVSTTRLYLFATYHPIWIALDVAHYADRSCAVLLNYYKHLRT